MSHQIHIDILIISLSLTSDGKDGFLPAVQLSQLPSAFKGASGRYYLLVSIIIVLHNPQFFTPSENHELTSQTHFLPSVC